jgi:hypothetical protein
MGISRIDLPVALLIHLIHRGRVLRRRSLAGGRGVPNGREMRTNAGTVGLSGRRLRGVGGWTIPLAAAARRPLSLFVHLALVVLFFLASLPFLTDLFEF